MVTPKPKGEKGGFIMKRVLKAGAVVLAIVLVIASVVSSCDPRVEILNKRGVIITYEGLSKSSLFSGVRLEVKNDSSRDIVVDIEGILVDGVIESASYYKNIKKGKISKDTLNIYSNDIDLSDASEIEFTIKVKNAKTYDIILEETKTLTLK